MSTTNPPGPSTSTSPPPGGAPPARREIKLVSHSTIFYWWPIWVLGYVFALMTYFEDHRFAIVPAGTEVFKSDDPGDGKHVKFTLVMPGDPKAKEAPTRSLERAVDASQTHAPAFKPRMSQKAWMAPIYCVVLLLTILITNVPLRGLWSFLVIMMLVLLALVFTVFDVWDSLLGAIGNLHIYINMAGYLFLATVVLILWLVSVFIFDQRTYIVFTPGQIRVCEHIGASIRNYDTTGMTFEKQRDDLFRHWILGFFSGDLIVRTAGAEHETIRLPNVLWIGWRLEEIQELLREKQIAAGPRQ
jgi:hypothetical protein